MREVTWQLAPRPASEAPEAPPVPAPPTEGKSTSGTYSIEASAQVAQPLAPPRSRNAGIPDPREGRKSYFEDLDPELQNVLRAQLQKPGHVSAVIETPNAFLIFVAKEKSAPALSAYSLSLPKRSFEEWLARQPAEMP